MKKTLSILLASTLVAGAVLTGFGIDQIKTAKADGLDQSNSTGTQDVGFGNGSTNKYACQGFKPTYNRVTAVSVYLTNNIGTEDMLIWVDAADSNSYPTGTLEQGLGRMEIPNSQLAYALTKYTFSSPITVTPNNQYVFCVAPWDNSTHSYATRYRNFKSSTSNPYANGKVSTYSTSGSTWSNPDSGALDRVFEVYGTNAPTITSVTKNITTPYPGQTVTFTGAATDSGGSIVSYAWNFGDSSTGSGSSPTHSYAANGSYTVTLTVTDNDGATTSQTLSVTVATTPTWTVQGVDEMKNTKDVICTPPSNSTIDSLVAATVEVGANFMPVATPYGHVNCGGTPTDSDTLATTFITKGRAANLRIWHRHAQPKFEGIYGATKERSPDGARHLKNIADWIHENASLIQNGDIFTPEAEPQNGGISGVTSCGSVCQFSSTADFNEWLRLVQLTTKLALQAEGFTVTSTWGDPNGVFVGAYGFDGFITWGNDNPSHVGTSKLEAATVAAMDNYIAIDHYNSAESMATDLDEAHTMWPSAYYIIGEWGSIGATTDSARLTATQDAFTAFAARSWIKGVNYWHMGPGTNEGLLNSDLTKRPHFYEVQGYYK